MKKHLPQAISHQLLQQISIIMIIFCRSTFLQEVMFISLFAKEINKRMIRQLIADKYGMKSASLKAARIPFS